MFLVKSGNGRNNYRKQNNFFLVGGAKIVCHCYIHYQSSIKLLKQQSVICQFTCELSYSVRTRASVALKWHKDRYDGSRRVFLSKSTSNWRRMISAWPLTLAKYPLWWGVLLTKSGSHTANVVYTRSWPRMTPVCFWPSNVLPRLLLTKG